MANDRDAFISSSLQLGRSSSRAETYGRPDGLRAGARAAVASVEEAIPTETGIPGVVMLIAIYEFCRAIIVGGVFGVFTANPGAELSSRALWQVFFIVSNGMMGVSPLALISCIYGLAIGLALFFRIGWGRRILIASSIYSVLRLARFLAVYTTVSGRLAGNPLGTARLEFMKEGTYMLVAVNIAIGLCMAFGPGASQWFRKQA